MKRLIYIFALIAIVASLPILLHSCTEDDDCSANARPLMECNIFTINPETGSAVASVIDLITVTALETDSVIINRKTSAASLSLPLRYSQEETKFVFNYIDQEKKDTITVYHNNTPYFLTLDCGFQMKQEIISIEHTTNLIDSIVTTHNNASINGTENIQIFY